MSARNSRRWQLPLASLGLALCLLWLPVEVAAQRGGGHGGGGGFHGGAGFGGGGFHGGGGFSGARMAAPTFRPAPRPRTFARGPQASRGAFRYTGPRYGRPGVPRSSYYRPAARPEGTRLASRGPGPRSGQGWQRFGRYGHHHRFFNSNFWFNPFYNAYFLNPFFWAPYPFYDSCTPYYSDYGDESGYAYQNGPPEENEAEAASPEENEVPVESQYAAAPLEQTVVVELADGRTKTFTWKGDRMVVTESPAPSKAPPAPPAPQGPASSLQ